MKRSLVINDIEIDWEGIYSISHHCRPGICKNDKCCCSSYEICIDKNELSVITGWLPIASRFSPRLQADNGFDNIFDELGPDLFALDTDEKGLCVFAYSHEGHKILCSLHAAALHMNLPPRQAKPKSCLLWPLAITEGYPVILSVDDDAFSFKCNKRRKRD